MDDPTDKRPSLTETLFRTRFEGATLALLRIGTGLLFMEHGAQKLFGWLGGFGGTPGGTAEFVSRMGLAGVLEFFGGFLITIGLLTRPVALILIVEMLAAYWIAHLPRGGTPIENRGELALLYALVYGYLLARGSGPWSVDGWYRNRLRRRREAGSGAAADASPRAAGRVERDADSNPSEETG